MLIYSKILSVIGLSNIAFCSGFSIYYFIKPTDFAKGTFINNLAYAIGFFGFFIMMILMVIYGLALGEKRIEELITFNALNIPLYILFTINLLYRLFFDKQLSVLGSSTPSKVAATLALALLLNLTTVTMAINYVKQN